jgi:2-polyprenyl-6-methoxyphenol hydroxylase-like FAD-dependent oxidoreductase
MPPNWSARCGRRAVCAASQLVAHEVPAALQVLAEGRDSATRERLGVRMPRQAYGQRGVAARLRTDQPHAGLARQWFQSPAILALLPMDRPQAGQGYGPGVVGAGRASRRADDPAGQRPSRPR